MVLIPINESLDLKAVDETMHKRFECLKDFDLNLFPLLCKKEYLPHLSFMFDVDINSLDEQKTKELLSCAITLKKYIGSVYYLEEMLKLLFTDTKVFEWFSYSGEPYYFKVEVKAEKNPITKEFYEKLEKAIAEYKNVRSVLEKIVISTKVNLGKKYALATLSGETIKVEPLLKVELKLKAIKNYSLACSLEESLNINLTIGDQIEQ